MFAYSRINCKKSTSRDRLCVTWETYAVVSEESPFSVAPRINKHHFTLLYTNKLTKIMAHIWFHTRAQSSAKSPSDITETGTGPLRYPREAFLSVCRSLSLAASITPSPITLNDSALIPSTVRWRQAWRCYCRADEARMRAFGLLNKLGPLSVRRSARYSRSNQDRTFSQQSVFFFSSAFIFKYRWV